MIETARSLEPFDGFASHVDRIIQATAGPDAVAFDLDSGRCAAWRCGRFRIRVWPTQVGIVAMIELDHGYRDDFLDARTLASAESLGKRLAHLLAHR